jgi:hypothetical protein
VNLRLLHAAPLIVVSASGRTRRRCLMPALGGISGPAYHWLPTLFFSSARRLPIERLNDEHLCVGPQLNGRARK